MANKTLITKKIDFSRFTAESLAPDFRKFAQEYKDTITELLKQEHYTWDNFIKPIFELDARSELEISPAGHIYMTISDPEFSKEFEALIPERTELSIWLNQNQDYFNALKAIKNSPEFATYDVEQKKHIENSIDGFVMMGADLSPEKQAELAEIQKEINVAYQTYGRNVLEHVKEWNLHITDLAELDGLPESNLELLANNAKINGFDTGYLITLDQPITSAVVPYAKNRELRKKIYDALVKSNGDGGKHDNNAILKTILDLRQKQAQVLGFDTHAAYTMKYTKMVKKPEEVKAFLENHLEKALPFAAKEYKYIQDFAKKLDGLEDLQAYDVSYYINLIRETEYKFNEEAVREYFPEKKVMSGLFIILEKLFGVVFKLNKDVNVYHPDVKYYDVYRGDELIAGIYFDSYVRKGKRGGAWMNVAVSRYEDANSITIPVAYSTCNFRPPVDGKDALFSLDEINTLFHEMGHCMHLLLTTIKVPTLGGPMSVDTDAVEVPSQFLENWAFNKETIGYLSSHYLTNEPLPAETLDKILALENFNKGMFFVRQLEFGLFDINLHSNKISADTDYLQLWQDTVAKGSATYTKRTNKADCFPLHFNHIFSATFDYSAGYYSYLWSLVLACDAFDRFEKEGIFNPDTVKSFVDNILAIGGAYNFLDQFVSFRGRKPEADALLRQNGLV